MEVSLTRTKSTVFLITLKFLPFIIFERNVECFVILFCSKQYQAHSFGQL